MGDGNRNCRSEIGVLVELLVLYVRLQWFAERMELKALVLCGVWWYGIAGNGLCNGCGTCAIVVTQEFAGMVIGFAGK
ncbi:hypothetical protein C5167_049657 [Papaver somniferum]|uniref:Uncharacterized protein n=1 Tax=Papaver somniferum TaxID=3469 RepID=A0A4Y7KPB0_PAPSO|nr:hypothetical protein C5167_049657 [Papaver somniferum]